MGRVGRQFDLSRARYSSTIASSPADAAADAYVMEFESAGTATLPSGRFSAAHSSLHADVTDAGAASGASRSLLGGRADLLAG